MSKESQNQAKEHLRLSILRCQQEQIPIWEVTSSVTESLRNWAEQEKLEVKFTVSAK